MTTRSATQNLFPIIEIPPDAHEGTEPLGSKTKFWFQRDDRRWLFKKNRDNTGEDWSEKIASEIAHALGIESATVELASSGDQRGCISKSFIDVAAGESLVHGNEILGQHCNSYDKTKFRQSDHTLENIYAALRQLFKSEQLLRRNFQKFASYMVLDALIGNTDRHHENWGIQECASQNGQPRSIVIAPSFDHASSLGRELLDEKREQLLEEEKLSTYLAKGKGGIFRTSSNARGDNPLDLVRWAADKYPEEFKAPLQQLVTLSPEFIKNLLWRIPPNRASDLALNFAHAMLLEARATLIEMLK
jgi:hypothetical protein